MKTINQIYSLYEKFPNISTDTRKITPGCLYFALKGENFNGNVFAPDAIAKGASYAIIDDPAYTTSQTILVNDSLKTLQELANLHRKKLGIPVLAITGTNGKTTTKELVAAVLSEKFNTSFTRGNLNNHIGVPLTLLEMDATTEFAVVEMGANHPGEIAFLCSIADPDYGIITNIGQAHLEGFGSFEGVKQTKSELYRHLKEKNGTVFYNLDNPVLKELTAELNNKISYGTQNADLNAKPVQSPPYIHLQVNFPKGILYLNTNLIGNYNFENVAAAACIGNYFKVDPLKIQHAVKEYKPQNNRSQLIKKDKLNIIMDAYNANPTSMKASVNSFYNNTTGNKYLILGDMLELGEHSIPEHSKIIGQLEEMSFEKIFLVGKIFNVVADKQKFTTFETVDELCAFFTKEKIKNGNILIKGSRGIRLENILKIL